jgi:hypothetical protein
LPRKMKNNKKPSEKDEEKGQSFAFLSIWHTISFFFFYY